MLPPLLLLLLLRVRWVALGGLDKWLGWWLFFLDTGGGRSKAEAHLLGPA